MIAEPGNLLEEEVDCNSELVCALKWVGKNIEVGWGWELALTYHSLVCSY